MGMSLRVCKKKSKRIFFSSAPTSSHPKMEEIDASFQHVCGFFVVRVCSSHNYGRPSIDSLHPSNGRRTCFNI